MKLEDIGFYTLSEERCKNASSKSLLQRCELVLTGRCNFRCPYCRRVGGPDLSLTQAEEIVRLWCEQGLKNIRFSGGEPTLYYGLSELVRLAKTLGCARIALSTNGSASFEMYELLLAAGVNDFSISLDACCASDGDMMAGVGGMWSTVVDNIRRLSAKTYVTVGVVLTDANSAQLGNIISFADSLGVSDIRVIPAAQNGDMLKAVRVSHTLLNKYPILRYRIENLQNEKPIRGIGEKDTAKCGLCLDDIAINGNRHFPCIIYMREGGNSIDVVGPGMRQEREKWYLQHNTKTDPICAANCLDVCVAYNNRHVQYHEASR